MREEPANCDIADAACALASAPVSVPLRTCCAIDCVDINELV